MGIKWTSFYTKSADQELSAGAWSTGGAARTGGVVPIDGPRAVEPSADGDFGSIAGETAIDGWRTTDEALQ